MSGHVLVEGVVATLKAGAYGGTGAGGRPPATRACQTTASRARFGGATDLTEENGSSGEGTVALADAIELPFVATGEFDSAFFFGTRVAIDKRCSLHASS